MLDSEDLKRAKEVACEHGFTWNDDETVEGFIRNLLTVIQSLKALQEEESFCLVPVSQGQQSSFLRGLLYAIVISLPFWIALLLFL